MKIIYGIAGEGMGHAIRSSVIIDHLIEQGHDIYIISSGRSAKHLKKKYNKVVKVTGLVIKYKGNKVDKIGTILSNAKSSKKVLKNMQLVGKLFKKFSPNLVITDFESISAAYAKKYDIPVLAIDNIQGIHRCKTSKELHDLDYKISKSIVQMRSPYCKSYFITSFFSLPIKKKFSKGTRIFHPVIRPKLINLPLKNKDDGHIVVYQTSDTNNDLIDTLKQSKETFIVYGYKRDLKEDEIDQNIIFKPFSEDTFIHDLATCKAVIAGGGFTVMTESLFLHKPMLCLPIVGQFEQQMNAYYLEKMGYGKASFHLTTEVLCDFIDHIDFYRENLKDYKHDCNKSIFEAIDNFLKEYA